MSWVSIFASGLMSFFNRVIVTGLLGKAIFLVILSWVVSIMLSGLVAWIAGQINVTNMGVVIGGFGAQAAAFGFWAFGLFVAPGLAVAIGGRITKFIIRRLPVIG
jgi:hypothetical protein